MSEEIEKFIKRNYDNIRRAYEFDNIARKKVVESYKSEFSGQNVVEPTWELVSARIRMEWESLKELLDPMNATREALLPIVEKRGEMLATGATDGFEFSESLAGEAMELAKIASETFISTERNIEILSEAGAYIVAAIEKLQKEAKG